VETRALCGFPSAASVSTSPRFFLATFSFFVPSPSFPSRNFVSGLAIGIEEPDYPLGLLEGLDQAVKENAVEAPIAESDAILVMFEEGVHGYSSVVRYLELNAMNVFCSSAKGYQGQSPWLVSRKN
jgi:hypothetical protein